MFENKTIHIGSEETNDVTIDSLAVAPVHAAVAIHDGVSTIKQLNNDFPLIVNGQKIQQCNLQDNDMITLGKHDIVYHSTEAVIEPTESVLDNAVNHLNHEIESDLHIPVAGLQIMNGQNIGKLLSLKKAMTRLGNNGSGVVVIAKRKDGYFVSALENSERITVNNKPLNNDSLKLNHNDVLVINNTSLQFFLS
ncbi:MAG: FHA domain-containing protein [Methylococcaceae bacterium]